MTRTVSSNGAVTLSAVDQITAQNIQGGNLTTVTVNQGIATISSTATDFDRTNIYAGEGVALSNSGTGGVVVSANFNKDNVLAGSGITISNSGTDNRVVSTDPAFIRNTTFSAFTFSGSITGSQDANTGAITITGNGRNRTQVRQGYRFLY